MHTAFLPFNVSIFQYMMITSFIIIFLLGYLKLSYVYGCFFLPLAALINQNGIVV